MMEWLMTISEATSPIELNLNVFDADVGALFSVVLICGLCLVATAIWALTVAMFTRSTRQPF